MSDVAALIADMVRAGVDPEIIGRTAAALSQNVQVVQNVQDPVADRRRAYDRDRKAAKKLSTGIPPESSESADRVSPKKETSPEPPKEKTTPSISPSVVRAQFEELWMVFPNKVGKRDAEKAFLPALQRASFEAILSGAKRYAAKTDDRPWCNPSTFLNQDRWADQPADLAPRRTAQATAPPKQSAHNEILDAIIRGENVSPSRTNDIDASYERTGGGGPTGPVRLYALPSGRR